MIEHLKQRFVVEGVETALARKLGRQSGGAHFDGAACPDERGWLLSSEA